MAFVYIYPPQSVSVATPPVQFELDGVDVTVSQDTVTPANSNPFPVIQLDSSGNPATPLTDAQLRASPVPVSGPLTDIELRATPVPISGTVTANTGLSQPLTDSQLRASAVLVSGPLTDVELRATPVPISGTVTANTGLSQPLTDAQLRASAVPVDGSGVTQPISAASLPLPTGAATESSLLLVAQESTLLQIMGDIMALLQQLPATLGQKASSDSLATVLSTEQEALLNDIKSNTASKVVNSVSQSTTITSATLTAPSGVKGFTIQNSTRATGALRFTQTGGGASASVGFLLEPGQSTSYQDGASSLDVFAVDGTAIDACVVWYV
jgi:hypothetical protein